MNTTSEKKVSRKSVKVETSEHGFQYFNIYEVRVRSVKDEIYTVDRYLNEKDAEEAAEIRRACNTLYKSVWVSGQMVWIK